MPRAKKIKKEVIEEMVTSGLVGSAEKEIKEGESVWKKISRLSTSLAIFLLPTIFIPGTAGVIFIMQETVIGILVLFSFFSFLIDTLQRKSLSLPRGSRLTYSLFSIFVLGAGASLFFSPAFGLSFWGNGYTNGTPVLTFIIGLILFFLAGSLFQNREKSLVRLLIFSWFISLLLTVAANISVLYLQKPFFGITVGVFNMIGNITSLSIFLGIGFIFSLLLLFYTELTSRTAIGLSVFGAVAFVTLLFVGSPSVFISTILTLLIVLGFRVYGVWGEATKSSRFLIAIVLSVVALSFASIYGAYRLPLLSLLPPEVIPSFSASVSITSQTLQGGYQAALFGSGPNTYAFDYGRFRPLGVNLTPFWNTDLETGYSFWLTILPTFGLTASLALFFFLAILVARGARQVIRRAEGGEFSLYDLVWVFVFYLVVISLTASLSSTLTLYLFFFAGLLFSSRKNYGEYDIHFQTARRAFIGSLMTTAALFLVIVLIFFLGQRAFSFLSLNQILTSSGTNTEAAALIPVIGKSYQVFPNEYTARVMSSLWFSELAAVMNNTQPASSSDPQALLGNSLGYANEAVLLNPINHKNWALLGDIYKNVLSATGALDQAIVVYEKAAELHPTHPLYPLFLSQIKLAQSGTVTSTEKEAFLKVAEGLVKKSIALKSNTPESYFVLAQIYDARGEEDQVIPALNQAITLNPEFLDARYFLASVYEKQGNKEGERVELEAIQKLSPGITEVESRLEALLEGK